MVEKVLSHLRCMLCGGVQRWEGGREGLVVVVVDRWVGGLFTGVKGSSGCYQGSPLGGGISCSV